MLNSNDKIDWVGTIGIDTTLETVLESSDTDSVASSQNASFLGLVNSIVCPENEVSRD